MGFYINPQDTSKEEFLEKHGSLVSNDLKWKDVPKGNFPVVLVDNGRFTAAGVCCEERELEEFLRTPNDYRPKKVFLVKIKRLLPVVTPTNFEAFLKQRKII